MGAKGRKDRWKDGQPKINDLRSISKSHEHLQSMVKTAVKFQNNRNKTVGGHKAHTPIGGGGGGRGTEGQMEGRKAKNYVPLLFFEKAVDRKPYG